MIALPFSLPVIIFSLSLVGMETLADFGTTSFLGVKSLSVFIFNIWAQTSDSMFAIKMSFFFVLFHHMYHYCYYYCYCFIIIVTLISNFYSSSCQLQLLYPFPHMPNSKIMFLKGVVAVSFTTDIFPKINVETHNEYKGVYFYKSKFYFINKQSTIYIKTFT